MGWSRMMYVHTILPTFGRKIRRRIQNNNTTMKNNLAKDCSRPNKLRDPDEGQQLRGDL